LLTHGSPFGAAVNVNATWVLVTLSTESTCTETIFCGFVLVVTVGLATATGANTQKAKKILANVDRFFMFIDYRLGCCVNSGCPMEASVQLIQSPLSIL